MSTFKKTRNSAANVVGIASNTLTKKVSTSNMLASKHQNSPPKNQVINEGKVLQKTGLNEPSTFGRRASAGAPTMTGLKSNIPRINASNAQKYE